jgi:hypothetical protein
VTDALIPPTADPEDVRSSKKPVVCWVDICLDPDAAVALAVARAAFDALSERPGVDRDEINARRSELDALRADAVERKLVVRYTFRAVGRRAYKRLQGEHPATTEQQEQARIDAAALGITGPAARLAFNPETFPPVFLAAASFEPKLSEEQAREMWDGWNDAEAEAVFEAARDAQRRRYLVDLA